MSSSWNLVGFVNIYIYSWRQPLGRLEIKNIRIPSRGYNTKGLLEAKGRFKKDQEAYSHRESILRQKNRLPFYQRQIFSCDEIEYVEAV